MPSKEAHLAAARRNQATIDYLLQDDKHLCWTVAVAFYKALHMIEAFLEADPLATVSHTDDHKSRNSLLRTTRRYSHIWKNYQPLYQASLIARYLQENQAAPTYDVFPKYMPRRVVENMVLNHYLVQIQQSIERLLGNNSFFAEPQAAADSQSGTDAA